MSHCRIPTRSGSALPLVALLWLAVPSAVSCQPIAGGHVRMRLTAVGTSPTRGQNLVVQLVPEYPGMADTLLVHFPAHSFTRHEAELIHLFRSSVKRMERGAVSDRDPTFIRLHPADSLDVLLKVPRRSSSFNMEDWRVVRVTTK